jgi:hypothetical protein
VQTCPGPFHTCSVPLTQSQSAESAHNTVDHIISNYPEALVMDIMTHFSVREEEPMKIDSEYGEYPVGSDDFREAEAAEMIQISRSCLRRISVID